MSNNTSSSVPNDALSDSPGTAHAEWHVPAWVQIPRLELLLGSSLRNLAWATLQDLVSREVAEDLTLEFKSSMYEPGNAGKQELLKDAAALANAAGGLIVLGIDESDGQASALAPIALSEADRRRMVDVLTQGIAPLIPDLTIGEIRNPGDGGSGVYLILVPPSVDAPHAVRRNEALAWPVREDRQTRWMREPELASRYRDRFSLGARQAQRLEEAAAAGLSCLDRRGQVWLTISLSPTRRGHLAPDRDQCREWLRQVLMSLPGGISPDAGALRGRRKVIFTNRWNYSGLSNNHHIELHSDGAGFAAVSIRLRRPISDLDRLSLPVHYPFSTIDLEEWTVVLIRILAEHAINAGAGGDFALRAELLPGLAEPSTSEEGERSTESSMPLAVVAAEPFMLSNSYFGERVLPGSRPLNALRPLEVSAPPSITTSSADLVACAADVAQELIAEFGSLPSEPVLRRDGMIDTNIEHIPVAQPLKGWAKAQGVLASVDDNGTQT